MMSHLARDHPRRRSLAAFHRNRSEQFEARFPSILLQGMAGSRMPIVVSHGEGRAVFRAEADRARALLALHFIDNHGNPAQAYPANPNGSAAGVTGFTTADGRFTIMMPHPERTARTMQMSWAPQWLVNDSPDASPWLRMFRNARVWLG
jgi:phosphoribosylformylglycinamidine synthase